MSSTDIRTYWLLCFCAAGLTLPLDVEAGLPALVPTEEHLTLQGDLTSGFFPPRQSASSVKVIGVTVDGLGVLQGPSEDAQNEAISDWMQADNASSYLDFVNCVIPSAGGPFDVGSVYDALVAMGDGGADFDQLSVADLPESTISDFCASLDYKRRVRWNINRLEIEVLPNVFRPLDASEGRVPAASNVFQLLGGNAQPAITSVAHVHDVSAGHPALDFDGPHYSGWQVFVPTWGDECPETNPDDCHLRTILDQSPERLVSAYRSEGVYHLQSIIMHELMHVIGAGHVRADDIRLTRASTQMARKLATSNSGGGMGTYGRYDATLWDPYSLLYDQVTLTAADKGFIQEHLDAPWTPDPALFSTDIDLEATGRISYDIVNGAVLPSISEEIVLRGCTAESLVPDAPYTYEDVRAALPRLEAQGLYSFDPALTVKFEFVGVAQWDTYIVETDSGFEYDGEPALNQRVGFETPLFQGDYWYTIDPTRNPSLHPEAHWLPLVVTIDYTGTGDVVWNNVVTTPIVWIPDCFAAN